MEEAVNIYVHKYCWHNKKAEERFLDLRKADPEYFCAFYEDFLEDLGL